MTATCTCVSVSDPILYGESPFWDHRKNQLWLSDFFGRSICSYDPTNEKITCKSFKAKEEIFPTTPIPFSSDGDKIAVTTAFGKVVEFDWTKDEGIITKTLYHVEKDEMANYSSAAVDSKGRLWMPKGIFKDPPEDLITKGGEGEWNKLTKSGDDVLQLSKEIQGFGLPMGAAWNQDETKMFWNDMCMNKRAVYVADFDIEMGKIGNPKVLFKFENEDVLQGSTPIGHVGVDVNSNLWIACWSGGLIIKIDTTTGKLVDKIDLPVSNVTATCFGGRDYHDLFVTTASVDHLMKPINEKDAGKIFKVSYNQDNSFKGIQMHFINL